MRRLTISLLLLFITTAHAEDAPGHTYQLITVEDGDTVTVLIGTQEKRLQLSGIDAPEDVVNPKFTKDLGRTSLSHETLLTLGKTATAHLKQLLSPGDEVRIVGNLNSSDRYGRIPVLIYRDHDRSVNEQMVIDGYAVALSKVTLQETIKERLLHAQQQAQESRLGLWGKHHQAALHWSGQTTTR